MGKLRHAAVAGPLTLPMTVLALCMASAAHAEVRFTPTIGATETYTDNVALARDDQARSAFVSEITPGFTLTDKSPRTTFSVTYQLHGYYVSGDTTGTNRAANSLAAAGHAVLIDDLLFLDASASDAQQAISPFGQQVANNGYASANRANVKSYQVTPSLVHSFGAFASTRISYAHNSVDSGGAGLGHSVGDSLTASLNSGRAFGRIGWGLNVQRQQLDDGVIGTTSSQSATLQGSYQLSTMLRLIASVGTEKFDYTTVNTNGSASAQPANSGHSWSTGFMWTPSARTSLQATYGKRYFGTTYSLNAFHHSRQTLWNLSYNEDVTTNRASFLSQSNVSTTAFVDNLFSAAIPDPVARAQAVAAYIASAGLPPTLANNTNYFSNRFQLQKQGQASVGLNSSRSTLLLAATTSKRTALSSVQADSDLLGAFGSAANDDTAIIGLSLYASYQLSSRSAINASANTTRNESVSTGFVDHAKSYRMALTRQFQSKLRASFEVRHVEGTALQGFTLPGASIYHENAISATLSLQL